MESTRRSDSIAPHEPINRHALTNEAFTILSRRAPRSSALTFSATNKTKTTINTVDGRCNPARNCIRRRPTPPSFAILTRPPRCVTRIFRAQVPADPRASEAANNQPILTKLGISRSSPLLPPQTPQVLSHRPCSPSLSRSPDQPCRSATFPSS
jgi:hypothetical protein